MSMLSNSVAALPRNPPRKNSVDLFFERASVVGDVIQARQTVRPRRLEDPAPDSSQIHQIFAAAGAAPDHGQVRPWRFITVPASQRKNLADVFAQSLIERDPSATNDHVIRAREKAYRSPLLILVVVDVERGNSEIDIFERTLSTGCAVQNTLLMATALGFGSALTSGKALKAKGLRDLFGLLAAEQALCFINIGTVRSPAVKSRRPGLSDFVSALEQSGENRRDAVYQMIQQE